ncbi:MAG: hypothetical protein WCT46_02375 [Candidatus Gracilibacteria bacterium]
MERIFDESEDVKDVGSSENLSPEGKRELQKGLHKLIMFFERGQQYANKEKTIQEWMERDRKKDELYETAQAPEDIRCLTCRNRMTSIFKDLWTETDREDRVLFMYECPNKCLPRRMFFSDGKEWRIDPDLCPSCDEELHHESSKDDRKIVTIYSCPKCDYSKTDEFVLTQNKEEEIDENFSKDRSKYCMTEEEGKEYEEAKWTVDQMAKLSDDWKKEEESRIEKLKQNPKGFHLEGTGYTCFICRQSTLKDDNWYDEWGIKCLVCQKAIDSGEIPARIAKDKDSWYSKYDLEHDFCFKPNTIRKLVKDGVLKERVVSYYGKGIHCQVFLIDENKDFLPPKQMVKYVWIDEKKDGKTYSHSEPWYKFIDPYEHLKEYKIVNYLKIPTGDKNTKEEVLKVIDLGFLNQLNELEKDAKVIFALENVSFRTREMLTLRLFSLIDYYSALWSGGEGGQNGRMINFLEKYLDYGREESKAAIEIWRHSLIHTGHPKTSAWQWNYENPPEYHWKLENINPKENGPRFYIGFYNLLNDLRKGLEKYNNDLNLDKVLQNNYESTIKRN